MRKLAEIIVLRRSVRYDLLCIEGIARALRIFLGLDKPPQYKLKYPPGGEADLITTTMTLDVRVIFTARAYDC